MSAAREACGVVGVYAPGSAAPALAATALQTLQHRGEESAGLAVDDGERLRVYRGLGLVGQALPAELVAGLSGAVVIGHTRYSTSGPPTIANAQPVAGDGFALAHNGHLLEVPPDIDNDSRYLVDLLTLALTTTTSGPVANGMSLGVPAWRGAGARPHGAGAGGAEVRGGADVRGSAHVRGDAEVRGGVLEGALMGVLPHLRGAFCLVLLERGRVIAARDRNGFRPLTVGRLPDGGWVVASETAALRAVQARVVRDVGPGELVVLDDRGVRWVRWAPAEQRSCLFEYVYVARPDSDIDGRSVYEARFQAGGLLARESPPEGAELVIGVPDSGVTAALGYAEESGLPYRQGFVRSPYAGRSFIQPGQPLRSAAIRAKLAPIAAAVRGRRIVVVDDSIVRGNTQKLIVRALRGAGAKEVHLRIASPPVRWPCFFGMDFATRDQLIAAALHVREIRAALDADSLAYLSLPGLIAASGRPGERLCRACMDGCYPAAEPDLLVTSSRR